MSQKRHLAEEIVAKRQGSCGHRQIGLLRGGCRIAAARSERRDRSQQSASGS
jgi:hypothetical protein